MEKWVYERVDKVLPNTPQYLKYVIDLGVSETKAKWLPFPVDTKLFRPLDDTSELRRKWGFAEKDHIIVFIGTLFEFSGLDEFIPQCHAIIEEVPEARLLIVGDGPQRPTLERIITDLSLQDRVIITGFQPYETMPQYINMATVCINSFCISEKTSDIFPAKIMQYVACGKATAATALRGIMSLLPGESHGVVYANSTDELAREVISLIKSPKRRYQLGQAGLAHVKHNYNHEKIAHQLEKILMKLIKEKKNDPAS
jgi:glycosyltransferase involved in cell wall biosynthesis